LTRSHPPRTGPAVRLALLLGILAALAVAAGVGAPASHAGVNPSNYDCRGHVAKGDPQPADDDTQVKYAFACNGPIVGYQIQTQLPDTGFDTSTTVTGLDGNPVTTDSFNCAGDFPGYGFNCTGVYSGNYGKVIGQFTIATALCAEPRVDPLLTVFYATADAKGVVTSYISGPFDLGRPQGCPKSARGGKTRIPPDGAPIEAPAPATKPAASTRKPKTARKHTR
jgi:hypothetical protein